MVDIHMAGMETRSIISADSRMDPIILYDITWLRNTNTRNTMVHMVKYNS